jgi:enamine deaminase RidA (YjgF/YER057c/UK114 family)
MSRKWPPSCKARRHVILPGRKTPLPSSDAVLAGDTVYLAGRIGIDPTIEMMGMAVRKS